MLVVRIVLIYSDWSETSSYIKINPFINIHIYNWSVWWIYNCETYQCLADLYKIQCEPFWISSYFTWTNPKIEAIEFITTPILTPFSFAADVPSKQSAFLVFRNPLQRCCDALCVQFRQKKIMRQKWHWVPKILLDMMGSKNFVRYI